MKLVFRSGSLQNPSAHRENYFALVLACRRRRRRCWPCCWLIIAALYLRPEADRFAGLLAYAIEGHPVQASDAPTLIWKRTGTSSFACGLKSRGK